jgi:hypothetical protein
VYLRSGDQMADIFVTVGAAQSTDITQALSADIQNDIAGQAIQVGPMGTPSAVHGQSFNLAVSASYQGTLSTQQGTSPIFGVFVELMNTSTGQSAFSDYYAFSVADLKAHAAEADSMDNSLG